MMTMTLYEFLLMPSTGISLSSSSLRDSIVNMYSLTISKSTTIIGLGIYLENLGILIVTDLHLGYEEVLAEQGVHLPRSQYYKIKNMLNKLIDHLSPETIVLLGDVKHEFGEATRQEWVEVIDLMKFLKSATREVYVVRGNHDNFLIPILRRERVPLLEPGMELGDFFLIHGHKRVELSEVSAKRLIMGHEHPAVAIRDDLGVKHKFKCFLKGDFKGRELIVLPALSPLMPGSEVNLLPTGKLLSPILRESMLENFRVFISDPEIGIYDFGELKYLSSL